MSVKKRKNYSEPTNGGSLNQRPQELDHKLIEVLVDMGWHGMYNEIGIPWFIN